MPEREKPFQESGEANLPDKAPDKGKEVYEGREEKPPAAETKPTLPVPRESAGVSSVDARQAAEKKAARLEQFNGLVRELREAVGLWNVAQVELIHKQRELQRVLQKSLFEQIENFLLSFFSGLDTKAEDAAQLAVNNARELSQVRLLRVKELLAIVRAAKEKLEQAGDEVDGTIKDFLKELGFIDSVHDEL